MLKLQGGSSPALDDSVCRITCWTLVPPTSYFLSFDALKWTYVVFPPLDITGLLLPLISLLLFTLLIFELEMRNS